MRPSWFLDAWVAAMLRHRAWVLVAVGAITLAFGAVSARLPLLTSLRDMLPDDTPDMHTYEAARERFGGDELVLIALEADAAHPHFDAAGIERLQRFTAALEANPFVERVISLAGADEMHVDPDDPDTLRIERFFRPRRSPAEVRAAALADPLVNGSLLSSDGEVHVIGVQLVPTTRAEARVMEDELRSRADLVPGGPRLLEHQDGLRRLLEARKYLLGPALIDLAVEAGYPRESVHAAGFSVIFGGLLVESERNIKVMLPLTMLVIGVVLALLLRRPVDALLPIVCVMPAALWAVGIGGLIFGRLTVFTSVAPIMVLVVGVSDVVHLVTQFRHGLSRGLGRDAAIATAFREVGTACALTSLTTLFGFGSMAFLPLPYSRELGIFAAVGVVCAFVLAFVLTPVLLSFTHPVPKAAELRGPLTRLLDALAGWCARRARLIVLGGFAISAASVAALPGLRLENALTEKLPADHPIREAFAVVDRHGGGTVDFELLIDAGQGDAARSGAMIAAMADIRDALEDDPRVHQSLSVVDLLERMHGLLAPDLAAEAPVPVADDLVAQYLLLFQVSGGRDLDVLLDESGRYARLAVRIPTTTAETLVDVAARLERIAAERLPAGVEAQANGIGLVTARAGPLILRTSLQGLGVALALIAALMAILFGSVRVGLLSIVPNLAPVILGVVMVGGVVGRVDADGLIFMAIALGIAVDDTIHFMTRFRIERQRGRDRAEAVACTLRETGHGIVRTSVILCAGFLVVATSEYAGLRTMGTMLPVTLAAAVVLDLTLVPAMAMLGMLEPRSGRWARRGAG